MIDSDAQLLTVSVGAELKGVVTADAILETVQPFLDAATVDDASAADLVTLDPASTYGEALHVFRDLRIAHLPVVEEDRPVSILRRYDVTDLTVRSGKQSQGGDASVTDCSAETSLSVPVGFRGFGARGRATRPELEILGP